MRVVSYVIYLRQMICPAGLAVLYPYPRNGLPGWEIALVVMLLAAISAAVFLRRQRQPYLLVGWLWYLGMLVPAIGVVQSGLRAHADRYTYLPQIGLYLAIVWTARDLTVSWRNGRQILGVGALSVIVALMVCTWKQTSYWRTDEILWERALACTSGNYVATIIWVMTWHTKDGPLKPSNIIRKPLRSTPILRRHTTIWARHFSTKDGWRKHLSITTRPLTRTPPLRRHTTTWAFC